MRHDWMKQRADLLGISLACSYLDIEHILPGRKDADEFFIVGAGGIIGHVEVQYHLIAWQDLGINVSSPTISLASIRLVFKWDEEGIAQNGFIDLKGIFLSIQ